MEDAGEELPLLRLCSGESGELGVRLLFEMMRLRKSAMEFSKKSFVAELF